jgi:hypothetical protein
MRKPNIYSGQLGSIPDNSGQNGHTSLNGHLLLLALLLKLIIMARQAGNLKIIGTIDGITFYKMKGDYYARTKSSLDRKRILRDPRFERFRECSKVFGRASKLASQLYRLFPKEMRKHGVYGKLTGEFNLLFREGKTLEQAVEIMMRKYLKVVVIKEKKQINNPTINSVFSSLSNSYINNKGVLLNKNALASPSLPDKPVLNFKPTIHHSPLTIHEPIEPYDN